MANKTEKKSICSVERFHHFRCGNCTGWWGMGDAPKTRKEWFCPWCGVKSKYQKSNGK